MITLQSPHVALNDERSNMVLNMDWVVPIRAGYSPQYLIEAVARIPRRGLTVVFNCHGTPGNLQMGTGIDYTTAPLFRRWRGKVRKMWFYACSPAADGIGRYFCAEMAFCARCHVVAPTETQVETEEQERNGLPPGQLDTFEGMLLSFDPDGRINWFRRYKSTYKRHDGSWYANP